MREWLSSLLHLGCVPEPSIAHESDEDHAERAAALERAERLEREAKRHKARAEELSRRQLAAEAWLQQQQRQQQRGRGE